MKFSLLLSGENVDLAILEALSLAKAFGSLKSHSIDGRVLTIDFEGEEFFKRLAFSHEAIELFATCDFSELESVFSEIEIHRSFCVRVSGLSVKTDESLERKLGAILWRKGARVDLRNPEEVVRVYITPKSCYVGFLRFKQEKKQFSMRKPNLRPFFMPIVTLPKLSRAIVNLVSLKKGRVLDPMCGTGSFLIELGLLGFDFCGMDFYRDIVEGCRKNLMFMGFEAKVLQGDAKQMPFKDETFDGVVTDYPYFKATRKAPSDDLYEKSLDEIERVLKKNRRAVIVTNLDIKDFPMHLVAKVNHRVHGSLTRRIYVLKK